MQIYGVKMKKSKTEEIDDKFIRVKAGEKMIIIFRDMTDDDLIRARDALYSANDIILMGGDRIEKIIVLENNAKIELENGDELK